jgi:hypothetical protein
MSEPFLYLEDLVKAEVPKPPKSIGGGAKAPGARQTLAGGPKDTPKPSSKAQALAAGPAKGIGGGVAPPAQQTLQQKNPNPPVSPAAKTVATQTYEYWSGDGAPPSSGGWEKGPEGGWRRPEGSGGGGTGEAESLISDMKPVESEDPAVNQKAAQETDKKLVSSGDQETKPVSSSAAKIEESKQADSATPPASAEAKKIAKEEKNLHKEAEKEVRAEAKKAADKEAKEAKADVAIGADGKPKGKPADTRSADEIEMEAGAHKKAARTLLSDMQAHLDAELMDPVDQKHLEATIKVLEQQSSMPGVPGKDDTAKLKLAAQVAKQHNVKPPKPEEEPKEQVSATPKTNYGAIFDQGRAAGSAVGSAAATAEGAGGLASTVLNYGASGAVRSGHHLLQGDGKAAAAEAAPKKAPTKGAEVDQSSMKTAKSLPLYLDLDILKAVNAPNIGNTTPTESRARIKHESSYAKRPVGVANEGIVTEDDPDEGKQWKHSDEDSVEADVDAKLNKEGKEDEDEDEEETEKALLADPSSLLKSLNTEVRNELNRVLPSDNETSFMVDVLQYDPDLVSKGQKNIMGKDRHRFNEWMQGRLSKSISLLTERIVIK